MEPLEVPVTFRDYVDSNYSGNLANRSSHYGILIYANNVLINFYIRRYNTVESSIFGSDYLELRITTDMVEVLRYKLRTFGVNLEGPEEIYCDNKSVV